MKSLFTFFIVSFFATSVCYAQAEGWHPLEKRRQRTTATGMYLLGGWATVNLVVNPLLATHAEGTKQYFYQTNTAWNMLNLGLAGISLWQISRTAGSPTWQAAYKEQYFSEQLFLVNSTLNVGFIAAGIYLSENSGTATYNAEYMRGAGRSLMVQGSFLLAFDVAMYFAHHRTRKEWTRYLQHVSAGPMGIELGIPIR